MLDPHREIQALIDSFVAGLGDLAKRIALDQLKHSFRGVKLMPPPSPPATQVRRSPSPAASPPPAAAPSRRGRARRGQHEIEALRDKLLAVIADNPGCRAEDINAALGTRTPQIAQPLRRLVVEQRVRTEGARRGTRYFSAGGSDGQNGRRPAPEAAAGSEEPAG